MSRKADLQNPEEVKVAISKLSADQALLVGWSGFNRALLDESKRSFFNVRLWDSDALIQAILRNYERLSDEIKAELPEARLDARQRREITGYTSTSVIELLLTVCVVR